jgi:Oxysterol-binding protein
MRPKPQGFESMYNFSSFALQLNYLPDSLRERLPPTDSRLRPDQRALEDGDTDVAIKEKHRLEESQRDRKKQLDKTKMPYKPAYFEL